MADACLYKSMPNLQRNAPFPIDFKSTSAGESMASPPQTPSLRSRLLQLLRSLASCLQYVQPALRLVLG